VTSPVRDKAKQEAEGGLKLKVLEKEEQIASMQRQIEELKRRAEQGSQQLQGEVLELELESLLRAKFPRDTIEPIAKGEFGGFPHRFIRHQEEHLLRKTLLATVAIATCLGTGAFAAVELNTYANKEGYLDVQALTCAQLADTFQEDANYLTAWYSGWYNGLAKKHFANIPRSKEAEHETIVYCKAHPGDEKVIKVLGRIFDEYREKKGIEVHK
jgi:hypothetical protein